MPTHTLPAVFTARNAHDKNGDDTGRTYRRRWFWMQGTVGSEAEVLCVMRHERSTSGGGRQGRSMGWYASLSVWPLGADEPTVERFSPPVRTQKAALAWLNRVVAEGRDAGDILPA